MEVPPLIESAMTKARAGQHVPIMITDLNFQGDDPTAAADPAAYLSAALTEAGLTVDPADVTIFPQYRTNNPR